MRGFVIAAFVAAFVFGYALVGPDEYRVARAVGVAIAFTFIGWLIARKTGVREGALVMAALAVFSWMGR